MDYFSRRGRKMVGDFDSSNMATWIVTNELVEAHRCLTHNAALISKATQAGLRPAH